MELQFRFARIQENRDWILPVLIALALIAWAARRYKIDGSELTPWKRWTLLILRCALVLGLFVFYLHPQWERIEGSSRVAIVIDTSSSMGTHDLIAIDDTGTGPILGTLNPDEKGPSRLDAVIDWLKRSELIEQLREKHDVIVYGFDKSLTRLGLEEKGGLHGIQTGTNPPVDRDVESPSPTEITETKIIDEPIETSDVDSTEETSNATTGETAVSGDSQPAAGLSVEQRTSELKANGQETRLGDALDEILQQERGQPLAGIILISDGGQNSGRSPELAIEKAQQGQIPIYTLGVGATRLPLNFRIANFDAPERAFPDDPITIKGKIELQGGHDAAEQINGPTSEAEKQRWTIPVELWMRSAAGTSSVPVASTDENSTENPEGAEKPIPAPATASSDALKIGETEIELTPGAAKEVSFEILPVDIGKKILSLRIIPPKEDRVEEDNHAESDMEIVDRKDRVLLYAGGPMRDYQFLRTQLKRDKTMSVHVYLPWSGGAVSQDADEILTNFPLTREEMAEYDCVVAFDPDWSELLQEQIDVLEYWVARQGGGLVLVAGGVNITESVDGWTDDHKLNGPLKKIRALYPVDFFSSKSHRDHRMQTDTHPWPIKFTPAGEEADFLRPADSETESKAIWEEFPGMFSYMNVRGTKPAATLLATSSSPDAAGATGVAAIFVDQFYGSGRVFYIGNGELWRLRQIDEVYYEKIYTKIIRHASQGRLQRQSERGSLNLDKSRYGLGSTATIRVTMNDSQLNPMTQPTQPVDVFLPNGKRRTVQLKLDPNVAGLYLGHLSLQEEGNWRLQLSVPDTDEILVQNFQVRMSDLERENPARNAMLLSELAEKTKGRYYDNPENAQPPVRESEMYGSLKLFTSGLSSKGDAEGEIPVLTELLKIRSQKAVIDTAKEEDTMWIFLWALCGVALLEWLLRRLMRLA